MEYKGPVKPTNLSQERLAQITKHVQTAAQGNTQPQQQVNQERPAAPPPPPPPPPPPRGRGRERERERHRSGTAG